MLGKNFSIFLKKGKNSTILLNSLSLKFRKRFIYFFDLFWQFFSFSVFHGVNTMQEISGIKADGKFRSLIPTLRECLQPHIVLSSFQVVIQFSLQIQKSNLLGSSQSETIYLNKKAPLTSQ